MHENLLRKALQSGKTVSKKQRSKQDSQASAGMSKTGSRKGSTANSSSASPINSRGGSIEGSRQPTDDEASDSDEEPSAIGDSSTDGVLSGAADSLTMTHSWEQALTHRVDEILQRHKKSQDEREADLKWYLGLTQNHYAQEQITSQSDGLARAFLRAGKSNSDSEAILALKCLAVTVFTDQTEDFYDSCFSPLKTLVQTADSEKVKSEALHTYAAVVFVTGDLEYFTDALPFLLEIIETDGDQVNAPDSATVVTAAIEAHELLTSGVDDQETLEEISQDTIEALASQLESSAISVTTAAGEAIALMYEKSWREATPDEEGYNSDSSGEGSGPKLTQMYKPYRQTAQLQQRMHRLANTSARSTGKRERTSLKQTFEDAARTLESPRMGPRYSDATGWKDAGRDARKGKREGGTNRIKVRINDATGVEGLMAVDRWWKLVRLREVQRCVGQGFMSHWAANEIVRECLTEP